MGSTAERPDKRIVELPTGHNFRDLGGYSTLDGRRVRWRLIFRSGVMSRIAGKDAQYLRALGVDTICDLRTNGERSRRPTSWHLGGTTELWERDHDLSTGVISELVKRPDLTAQDVERTLRQVYRELPFEQVESYHQIFYRIARGRLPLVFNCSAGKDRTGIAAALLLTILGVPRATIEADYMLTNVSMPRLTAILENEPGYGAFVRERPDIAIPLLRAEPQYLAAMFQEIETRHGSVETYLEEAIGLSTDELDAVRSALIE